MNRCVVAVVAHPDDESLIAGGTLALAARAGCDTGVISLTRGEHGPSGAAVAPGADLGDVREAELQGAARELGVGWAVALRHPDGELPWVDHEAAADELADLLSERTPAAVLTFGPDGIYWHPDHTATHRIVGVAVGRLGGDAGVYEAMWPTGLMAELVHAAAERGLPVGLWGIEPEAFGCDRDPTDSLDVLDVLGRKLAALRAHRSQIGDGHLFATLPDDLAARFLSVERWVGPADGSLKELIEDR
jgi:LmbE family N-acetylglucosaminyl deacetylase